MRLAELAVTEHDPLILWSRVSPLWAGIRERPGFEALVRRVWDNRPG